MRRISILRAILLAALLAQICPLSVLRADDGYNAWLRYAPLTESERGKYASFPTTVAVLRDFLVRCSSVTLGAVRPHPSRRHP